MARSARQLCLDRRREIHAASWCDAMLLCLRWSGSREAGLCLQFCCLLVSYGASNASGSSHSSLPPWPWMISESSLSFSRRGKTTMAKPGERRCTTSPLQGARSSRRGCPSDPEPKDSSVPPRHRRVGPLAPGKARSPPLHWELSWAATASATTAASRACGRRPSSRRAPAATPAARRT